MTDRTTINIDKETHSKAKETKQKHGETWPEVIQFYAEYRPQVDNGELEVGGIPDGLEAIANGEVDTDEIERSLETIEERTGRIERTLEELQG